MTTITRIAAALLLAGAVGISLSAIGCGPAAADNSDNSGKSGKSGNETGGAGTAPAPETVKPEKLWVGRVALPMLEPGGDYQTPMKAIRDREAFLQFIGMIPETQILPTNPAPPSNDPLLKKPEVDFDKKMVLVATRGENMYIEVRFGEIVRTGDKLLVNVILPPVGDTAMQQSQLGIGTYIAAVVDRVEKVEFKVTREE